MGDRQSQVLFDWEGGTGPNGERPDPRVARPNLPFPWLTKKALPAKTNEIIKLQDVDCSRPPPGATPPMPLCSHPLLQKTRFQLDAIRIEPILYSITELLLFIIGR